MGLVSESLKKTANLQWWWCLIWSIVADLEMSLVAVVDVVASDSDPKLLLLLLKVVMEMIQKRLDVVSLMMIATTT